MLRFGVLGLCGLLSIVLATPLLVSGWAVLPLTLFVLLTLLWIYDLTQPRHAILRNYPVLGHMRFLFEGIRPEIRQDLIESDQGEEPFSRDHRPIVYQRAT